MTSTTHRGRKKAPPASMEETKKDRCPSSSNSIYDASTNYNIHDDDDGTDATGDYGIILVKKYKILRASSLYDKASNAPNHRGIRPSQEQHKRKSVVPEGGIVDRLTAVFCGATCLSSSDTYVFHEDPSSAAITEASEDTSATTSGNDSSSNTSPNANAILLRQDEFKEEEKQQKQLHLEESILTDVSFLTDGSPRDLELKDVVVGEEQKEMPSSSFNTIAKSLPAFRKPPPVNDMRSTQKKGCRPRPRPPMPSDLSKHTRKNPMWTNKMGTALRKTYEKKSKRRQQSSHLSSTRRKKRFSLHRERSEPRTWAI